MNHPDFEVLSFLAEIDRPASVATVTAGGHPALASMWFSFEDGRFWFHSPGDGVAPFVRAADRRSLVAVMVETFDPAGRVMKVRTTGAANKERTDHARVIRIYRRYVASSDAWGPAWDAQVRDPSYVLWSVEPTWVWRSSSRACRTPEARTDGAVPHSS